MSVTTRLIEAKPATGQKHLTLADLRQFVAATDGAHDDTPVEARVTVSGYLKQLRVRGGA